MELDEGMRDMLNGAKPKRGKQYNPLELQKPSSNVSLETRNLTKHLSAKNSNTTLLSRENLETDNKFVVIHGTKRISLSEKEVEEHKDE